MTEQPETTAADEQPAADAAAADVEEVAPDDLTNPDHGEDDDPDLLAGEELEDDGLDDETDGDGDDA